jgi:hypothetical protein
MLGVPRAAQAAEQGRDHTCFQAAAPYSPALDIGSDVAVVYGVNATFLERVAKWREEGYTASMMTGIAWGDYGDYYMLDGVLKKDEIQTTAGGKLLMHGNSKTVGYNVPSPEYIDYIKKVVDPAIDAGVQAIYMEEPEFWADAGWSDAFKKEWQLFYGEPWEAPDSSVDAQYRASKLKYELYFNALREVFRHIKTRAKEKGIEIECHVPTHSLINYAQWRIVSPESHLMDLQEMDGYIAQVWTGTARTSNIYRGVRKERTFETAFLEYGQMLAMVKPTGRKVWFLADPIEDNPNRSWADYKRNYECTVIASLMWPEVHRFEVMPWPSRIFNGKYASVDMDTKSDKRAGIPASYATQLLAVINALNDMDQPDVAYDTGSRGIGMIVSDTMMFQRAAPNAGDRAFGSLYGLALPFVKAGIPLEVVQLENVPLPATLASLKVLFLTYEHQKPLKPEYHEALARWVREGGCLVYVGDGSDPYHGVREWWNEQGTNKAKACDDLFARLGVGKKARRKPVAVGKGYVRIVEEKPSALQHQADGPDKVRGYAASMLALRGEELKTQNYLLIRRGPYVVASVLDESISEKPLELSGHYVDVFDPALPFVKKRVLRPGERTLLYDLAWARESLPAAGIVAAGARVRKETVEEGAFSFVARGPMSTTANMRLRLPGSPKSVKATPSVPIKQRWDDGSGTLWLSFDNRAEEVLFRIEY